MSSIDTKVCTVYEAFYPGLTRIATLSSLFLGFDRRDVKSMSLAAANNLNAV